MTSLSKDYRLSLYKELVELVKDKVYIVQYSLDDKLYIKKSYIQRIMISI